ncbi:MAG TPA: hypothetical protein VJP77_00600, partial [Planctomycetota bacterium]|nr:hypothetical protein [Planctomycetota bacterium]
MRLRLEVRVFLLVAVINLATFGAAGGVLVLQLAGDAERQALSLTEDLVRTLRGTIRPDRELNVAPILQWPGWAEIDDAVLLDRNLERGADGRVRPVGVAIHPVGRSERDPLLQEQPVLAALAQAIELEQP